MSNALFSVKQEACAIMCTTVISQVTCPVKRLLLLSNIFYVNLPAIKTKRCNDTDKPTRLWQLLWNDWLNHCVLRCFWRVTTCAWWRANTQARGWHCRRLTSWSCTSSNWKSEPSHSQMELTSGPNSGDNVGYASMCIYTTGAVRGHREITIYSLPISPTALLAGDSRSCHSVVKNVCSLLINQSLFVAFNFMMCYFQHIYMFELQNEEAYASTSHKNPFILPWKSGKKMLKKYI